jgi:hypothetical protein
MKYWTLAMSLFILGCGGGESGDSGGTTETENTSAGQDVADTLNDAQQAAKDVEATLQDKKKAIDDELDKADD